MVSWCFGGTGAVTDRATGMGAGAAEEEEEEAETGSGAGAATGGGASCRRHRGGQAVEEGARAVGGVREPVLDAGVRGVASVPREGRALGVRVARGDPIAQRRARAADAPRRSLPYATVSCLRRSSASASSSGGRLWLWSGCHRSASRRYAVASAEASGGGVRLNPRSA